MLFNSYVFIFLFIPIIIFVFYLIGQKENVLFAAGWLVCASLFFYAWWNPPYLVLILVSIVFNYTIGRALRRRPNKWILVVGIASNLGLLGYFKYANFFVDNFVWFIDSKIHLSPIVLPLAISFFTFQQIAYIVDTYRGETCEYNFLHYCLFVSFFPQLIAGPIVNHKEMLPQFSDREICRVKTSNLAIGLTIFFIGLAKKALIADNLSVYAAPVFKAAEQHYLLTFLEAWEGVLAYTFQIYFDFSGYSDMAIGLAFLFGIQIPLNFHSPYQAVNIVDFWRRWHMTLSRFLLHYLYIPLGGNRKGQLRRYINLMITMLLGGLWHGAAWTFVAWGALHGLYLIVNYAWQALFKIFSTSGRSSLVKTHLSRLLTFLSVTVAWVFFRAETFSGALNILKSMIGINGFALPRKYLTKFSLLAPKLAKWGVPFSDLIYFRGGNEVVFLFILFLIVWFAPNTHQIMGQYSPAIDTYRDDIKLCSYKWLQWQPAYHWAATIIIIMVASILSLSKASEFLYFQF